MYNFGGVVVTVSACSIRKCKKMLMTSCHPSVVHQIKMESTLENGCLCSMLRHTPQSNGEEEAKSATSGESAQILAV